MQKHLFLVLASKWKGFDRKLKKKVLIGLGLFSVMAFSLMIFVGVLLFKATGYVFSQAGQLTSAIQNPIQIPNQIQNQIQNEIPLQISQIPQDILKSFNVQSCSGAVMGLLAVEPWIRVPLAETFNSVKSACWPTATARTEETLPTDENTF